MKYTDITVGQQVLVSRHRVNSKHFHPEYLAEGVVVAVDVEHTYQVQVGGWSGGYEGRRTNQGVTVRVTREYNDGPRVSEETVLAAFLVPADGEIAAQRAEALAARAERQAEAERRRAQRQDYVARFAAVGVRVEADPRGGTPVVYIAGDNIEALLARLEG